MALSKGLKHVEIFQGLSDQDLEQVQQSLRHTRYKRGQYIYAEGRACDTAYFVDEGLVKLFKIDSKGRENVIDILGQGSLFPRVGLFDRGPYFNTAEALVNTSVFTVKREKLDDWLEQYPSIRRKTLEVFGKTVRELQLTLQEISVLDARDRLIELIYRLVEKHGRAVDGDIHMKMPITHTEMAHMVALSRESVNRIWNDLRRDGVITGDKDEWIISKQWFEDKKTYHHVTSI